MLEYALAFLIVAILCGVVGFSGATGVVVFIAKIGFIVFLVLFLLALVFEWPRRR
ncbi:MAG TPA: DUF1328 family protein [Candidatus Limnocylindrales bacterium]|nr:DUF1328 family protein [Candidatus Limnocylindrales bacterium]